MTATRREAPKKIWVYENSLDGNMTAYHEDGPNRFEYTRSDLRPASVGDDGWRPISQAPHLGELFLAAIAVYRAKTGEFMHYDYAVLYMDEGRLYFYDDNETGWNPGDYEICLPFRMPTPPGEKS